MSDSQRSELQDDLQFQAILAECLEALERGEVLDRDVVQRRHPKYAGQLAEFLDDHELLRQMATAQQEEIVLDPTMDSGRSYNGIALGESIQYIGEYRILSEIARGGMGVVFKAKQRDLKRIVALKMILAGRLANDSDVQRFRREAEAAARLRHPNIVPVHEVGEFEGHHYFTMDFIEGRSLAEALRDEALAPDRAAEIIKTIAEAVQYAHGQGTLHRDLKPANIILDAQDQPHITDFGLAKLAEDDSGESSNDLTATGQILGTPSYMSPEQASGKHNLVGPATDIYALGAILYACLTSRAPFVADSPVDTILQVIRNEPVSPRVLNPAVPKDIETICLKCLHKEPHKRYGTAQELADDLTRFLEGRPVTARPVGRVSKTVRWCRRNPIVASLLLLVAMSLLGGTSVASFFAVEANNRAIAERKAKERQAELRSEAEKLSGDLAFALEREHELLDDAVTAREEAEMEKQLAQEAQRRAQQAQSEEARQRRLAQQQTHLALQRENQARWHLYVSQLYPLMDRWKQQDLGQLDRMLDVSIPADDAPDFRGWEWYLLRDQATQMFRPLEHNREHQHIVKYHHATSRLAMLYADHLEIWNPLDEQKLESLPVVAEVHNHFLIDWSPDGKSVALHRGQNIIDIIDVATGKIDLSIATKPKHNSYLEVFRWSPDGERIASGTWHGELKIWDAASGDLHATLYDPAQKSNLGSLAWHRDSRRLAVGLRYGWTHLYDVIEAKRLWAKKAPNNSGGHSMAWSPDGSLLAAGHGGIVLYTAEGKRLHYFDCHRGSSRCLIWLDDRRIVSGGADQDIVILDAEEKAELRRLVHHTASVEELAWDQRTERLISSSKDGRIKIARLDSDPERFSILKYKDDSIRRVAFSPDDELLAVESRGHAGIWNPQKEEFVDEFECSRHIWHANAIYQLSWRPDGQMLGATCKSGPPIFWNRNTQEAMFPKKQFEFQPNQVRWSPNGKYLLLSGGKGTELWDGASYEVLHEFEVTGNIYWHSDSSLVQVGTVLIDPEQRAVVTRSLPEVGEVSPNRKLSAATSNYYSGGEIIILSSLVDGQELRRLHGHNGSIAGVVWSPDGRRLGSASRDGTIKIWDAATGDLLITLAHPNGEPYESIAWSHDGRRVVAGTTKGEVHLYGSSSMPAIPEADYVKSGLLASIKTHDEKLGELNARIAESPDDMALRRERIALLDQTQRWPEALAEVVSYLERSPGDTWRPTRGLLLASLIGDEELRRRFAARCLEIAAKENYKSWVNAKAAQALCLAPDLVDDFQPLLEVTRANAKGQSGQNYNVSIWLALLRAEEYNEL